MKVAVGSTNPVKIKAAKIAFKKVWPKKKFEVIGIEVSSGVSNQPMSDVESIKGARYRARRAMKKLNAHFGVGLEGGIQKIGEKYFDSGWAIVINKKGEEGIGSSIRMETPQKLVKRSIKESLEIGTLDDLIFKTKNSKHGIGHFGLMTDGKVTRLGTYADGLIAALARFIKPELF